MATVSSSAGQPVVASSTSATASAGKRSANSRAPALSLVPRRSSNRPPGDRSDRRQTGALTGAYLAAELFGKLPDDNRDRATLIVRDAIERACGVDPARGCSGFDFAFLNVITPVLVAFARAAGGQEYFSLCVANADVDQALIERLLKERRAAFVARMKAAKVAKRLRTARLVHMFTRRPCGLWRRMCAAQPGGWILPATSGFRGADLTATSTVTPAEAGAYFGRNGGQA